MYEDSWLIEVGPGQQTVNTVNTWLRQGYEIRTVYIRKQGNMDILTYHLVHR